MYMSTLLLSSDTPEEGVRSHYRWLGATMWLLGIELRISEEQSVLLIVEPSLQLVLFCFSALPHQSPPLLPFALAPTCSGYPAWFLST